MYYLAVGHGHHARSSPVQDNRSQLILCCRPDLSGYDRLCSLQYIRTCNQILSCKTEEHLANFFPLSVCNGWNPGAAWMPYLPWRKAMDVPTNVLVLVLTVQAAYEHLCCMHVSEEQKNPLSYSQFAKQRLWSFENKLFIIKIHALFSWVNNTFLLYCE